MSIDETTSGTADPLPGGPMHANRKLPMNAYAHYHPAKEAPGTAGAPPTAWIRATTRTLIHTHENCTFLDIESYVAQRYRVCYLNMLETVTLFRRGYPRRVRRLIPKCGELLTAEDYPMIADTEPTVLTPVFAHDFGKARVKGLTKDTPAYHSAMNSANAMLTSAQAMFSPAALDAYDQVGLIVPDISAFLSTQLIKRVPHNPQAPNERRLFAARADLIKLASYSDERFLPAALAFFVALTTNEIIGSGPAWIEMTPSGPFMRVWRGNPERHQRDVPIPFWLCRLLMSRPGPYFLDGGPYRRRETCRASVAWLQGRGSKGVRQPLEEYRSFCAWYFGSRYKATQVMSYMGHQILATTEPYMSKPALTPEFQALWQPVSISAQAANALVTVNAA